MPFDAQEYARALKQLPRERQRERLIQLRDKNPQAFTAVMSSMTAAEAPKPFGVPVEQGPDRRVVTQQFIESQLRGRVDNTTELPGGIQAQLSRVEELPRAIDTLGRSSELPRGTAPAGVTLPNGETRLYYRDEGTNQYHSVNRPGLSPGDVGLQLLQHAVQGGFGQAGLLDHGLQGEGRVLARNHLQQGKQAQVGGVAVDAGTGGLGGLDGHGLWIIDSFYLRIK